MSPMVMGIRRTRGPATSIPADRTALRFADDEEHQPAAAKKHAAVEAKKRAKETLEEDGEDEAVVKDETIGKDEAANDSLGMAHVKKIIADYRARWLSRSVSPELAKEQWQLLAKKLAKEKLAKEKLAKEKLAKEKLAKEKLAKEKLAKEKLAKEKLAKEKLAEETRKEEISATQDESKDMIVSELLNQGEMERLVRDSFGNYAVQTAKPLPLPSEALHPALEGARLRSRPMAPTPKMTTYIMKHQLVEATGESTAKISSSSLGLESSRLSRGRPRRMEEPTLLGYRIHEGEPTLLGYSLHEEGDRQAGDGGSTYCVTMQCRDFLAKPGSVYS
ncbi:Uu.00g032260.m01.CDS01 [Anthostomella pinea]|uniref:Uu.00g032260.m01.CDS01 n=1 Tax=Anthostomella pinea TaxID=933095 RepID=A0AAI8YDA5_9PEZI|nr:Uu.00g032260.m01.CDS01 [Anthostomella pinea]